MNVKKGNRIRIVDPNDPICGATAIVTNVIGNQVSAILLTVPKVLSWTPGDAELFTGGFVVEEPMENAWDFVERHYHKYHSCSEIALSDDLQKIVDDELDEDSCALELLNRDYGGDREGNLDRIKSDLDFIDCEIYKRSIESYIKEQNHDKG